MHLWSKILRTAEALTADAVDGLDPVGDEIGWCERDRLYNILEYAGGTQGC